MTVTYQPDIKEFLGIMTRKHAELMSSPKRNFRDVLKDKMRPKKGVLDSVGIYVIYKNNIGKIVHVGSAGKQRKEMKSKIVHYVSYRIADLFVYVPAKKIFHHEVSNRVMRERGLKDFRKVEQLIQNKYSFRSVKVDAVRDALMLE